MLRNLIVALVAALASAAAGAGEPHCPPPAPHCSYKAVTVYVDQVVCVTKSVPYTKEVTRYDHCGKPYTDRVTCYKDVQVEVTKKVPATKWVKVCG